MIGSTRYVYVVFFPNLTVACRGLVMPGAKTLNLCPKDSYMRPTTKKYFGKGRYFHYVNTDESLNKHIIRFLNHYLISLFDWMLPSHLDARGHNPSPPPSPLYATAPETGWFYWLLVACAQRITITWLTFVFWDTLYRDWRSVSFHPANSQFITAASLKNKSYFVDIW